MTVPERNPYNNWSGNGSTTTFDFDFYIENETQLTVYHTNAQGVQTLLKFGTDYSIDELKNANGSHITFPLSSSTYKILGEDEVISLCLTLPISQGNPYRKSNFLNLEALEYSLDYLTRLIQILNRQQERSVKVQEGLNANADELFKDFKDDVNKTVENAKTDISASMVQFKEEVTTKINTDISNLKDEQNEIIEANREELLTKQDDFETKITTDIDTVIDAASKINAMDEAVLKCEEASATAQRIAALFESFYANGINGGNAASIYNSDDVLNGGYAINNNTEIIIGGNAISTGCLIGDLIEKVRSLQTGVRFAMSEISRLHNTNY